MNSLQSEEYTDNFSRSIGRLEGKLDALINQVGQLATAFDSLEKGRLSRLELAFNTMETRLSTTAQNKALFFSIIGTIVSTVISALIVYFLVHQ